MLVIITPKETSSSLSPPSAAAAIALKFHPKTQKTKTTRNTL
jgi:hypothetical protein